MKILGAKKEKSISINNINPNDKIILFSTLNTNKGERICFFAYTMVEYIFSSHEALYGSLNSEKKLRLKGIKYFSKPIIAHELIDDLGFKKKLKESSSYFKSEYKEISEKGFENILNRVELTKEYPYYFENVSFSMEDFLFNTLKSTLSITKFFYKNKQIEIKFFLKIFRNALESFEVYKTYDEVEEFYSKNIWKLELKHLPSRNPEKSIYLFAPSGNKRGFSYISLE